MLTQTTSITAGSLDNLFIDGRVKLQPFCYDIATAQMVPPSVFVDKESVNLNWIYYFNTTPMIAGPNHPIIERALRNATEALEQELDGELPEVQATTGPGNLTRSIFEVISEGSCPEETIVVMHDSEKILRVNGHSVIGMIRETGGCQISKPIERHGIRRRSNEPNAPIKRNRPV